MKHFLIGLLYENGTPSRTGLAALILILVPLFIIMGLSIYLVIKEKSFNEYQAFISLVEFLIATGSALLGANKAMLTKWGSLDGQLANKEGGSQQ